MNTSTTNHDTDMNGVDTVALREPIAAIKEDPALARVTFTMTSSWLDGCRQAATTGAVLQNGNEIESGTARYSLESDEPAALLDTDKAASPGEYILQALAAATP